MGKIVDSGSGKFKPPFHLQVIAKSRNVPEDVDEWVNAVTMFKRSLQ